MCTRERAAKNVIKRKPKTNINIFFTKRKKIIHMQNLDKNAIYNFLYQTQHK